MRRRRQSSGCQRSCRRWTRTVRSATTTSRFPIWLAAARAGFEEALDDDLNISIALAAVFDLVRELNRRMADRGLSRR